MKFPLEKTFLEWGLSVSDHFGGIFSLGKNKPSRVALLLSIPS